MPNEAKSGVEPEDIELYNSSIKLEIYWVLASSEDPNQSSFDYQPGCLITDQIQSVRAAILQKTYRADATQLAAKLGESAKTPLGFSMSIAGKMGRSTIATIEPAMPKAAHLE
ncbi:MAG: hypothetical protein JWM11_1942 [Planctomycetaceae bacterium]|nr:hypothetical protein [Planctomycetaceae bacterium]